MSTSETTTALAERMKSHEFDVVAMSGAHKGDLYRVRCSCGWSVEGLRRRRAVASMNRHVKSSTGRETEPDVISLQKDLELACQLTRLLGLGEWLLKASPSKLAILKSAVDTYTAIRTAEGGTDNG